MTTLRDIPSTMFKTLDLDNTNWHSWKQQTLEILQDCGLDEYVIGKNKNKPGTPGDALENWKKYEVRAQTILDLTIGQSQVVHVMGATMAGEMWDWLFQVKEPKGLLTALSI